jgi:hypothetical protein
MESWLRELRQELLLLLWPGPIHHDSTATYLLSKYQAHGRRYTCEIKEMYFPACCVAIVRHHEKHFSALGSIS